MSAPVRIQRKRTKGWRMPEGAVYVGRPTPYGNPFTISGHWIVWAAIALGYRADASGRRAAAVALFTAWLTDTAVELGPHAEDADGGEIEFSNGERLTMARYSRGVAQTATALFPAPVIPERPRLDDLRGHDLACWCPLDQPCHADVLLEIANAAPVSSPGSREEQ